MKKPKYCITLRLVNGIQNLANSRANPRAIKIQMKNKILIHKIRKMKDIKV